jgi:hypothetical protein
MNNVATIFLMAISSAFLMVVAGSLLPATLVSVAHAGRLAGVRRYVQKSSGSGGLFSSLPIGRWGGRGHHVDPALLVPAITGVCDDLHLTLDSDQATCCKMRLLADLRAHLRIGASCQRP